MRQLAALFCAAGAIAGMTAQPAAQPVQVVLLGDHEGYLAPCGCTFPMTGGLLRQAAVVRAIKKGGNAVVVDVGGLVAAYGRQDLLKANALAQAFGALKVDAINLTADDAKLGEGELSSLQNLAKGGFESASVAAGPTNPLNGPVKAGPFLIIGLSEHAALIGQRLGESPEPLEDALKISLDEAKSEGLRPLVLLDGDESQAIGIARAHPDLAMVAYRSDGRPWSVPGPGNTVVATPGARGQYVVTITFDGDFKPKYTVRSLGPDVADDPQVSRFYGYYLREVAREHLWEHTVRLDSGGKYSGSEACAKCHQKSYKIWAHSKHAHALADLASVHHQEDPDCVACHVTGGAYRSGFHTAATTPQLENVGCESCHGAGADHARAPRVFHMPKLIRPGTAEPSACTASCHTLLNSPRFDFHTYWAKIRHSH